MATIDELRARAELIAEEQQIGGNTAERVGDAFDMVADIIEAVAPGDQQAVLYNPQSPNEAQKAQARANIGAQETISDIADFVKVSAQTFTAAQKQQARENIGAEQAGGAVKNLAGSASDTETLIKAANNPNLQANVHLSGNNIYVNGIAGGIDLDNNGVNLKAGNSGYPNAKVKVNNQEVATKLYVDGKIDDRADSIELALDLIEAVIPSQASAQNQLADKNYVNSSISSSTANFVGTFDSLAELQAVQNPTNNDYGFVIETDAVGNEYYDRYKYNGTVWFFEYKVESTPFTAAQWAAIQSGITSALVTKLSALPTNAELTTALDGKQDVISDLETIRSGAAAGATAVQPATMNTALAGKQNTLTFDSTPTASSTNPVTSGGVKGALDVKADKSDTFTKAEIGNLITPIDSEVIVGALPATGVANKVYRVPGTDSYTDYGWNGTQFVPLASFDGSLTAQVGYYTCPTSATTAGKYVTAAGFTLTVGGSFKVLFEHYTGVASPTLNMNSTGAKPIYLNGVAAGGLNIWKDGDVVEFYYDGNAYWGSTFAPQGVEQVTYASSPNNYENDILDLWLDPTYLVGVNRVNFRCVSTDYLLRAYTTGNTALWTARAALTAENGKIYTLSASIGGSVVVVGYVIFTNVADFLSKPTTDAYDMLYLPWVAGDIKMHQYIYHQLYDDRSLPENSVATPNIQDSAVTTGKIADFAVTNNKIEDKYVVNSSQGDVRGKLRELYIFDDAVGDSVEMDVKVYNSILIIRPFSGSSTYRWQARLTLTSLSNGVVYPLVVTNAGTDEDYGVGASVGYVIIRDITSLSALVMEGLPKNGIIANITDITQSPIIYAYIASQDVEVEGTITYPDIQLPSNIYIVRGDELRLYYRSVLKTGTPDNYDVRVVSSVGKSFPKYYQLVTSEVGNYTATFNLYDNNNTIVKSASTTIHVINPMSAPSSNKNVLVMGASATASGYIAGELRRRLTTNTGDGSTQNPTGLNLGNITFVGRKRGYAVDVPLEATGGWSWRDYAGEGRAAYRFYVTGVTQLNIGDVYTHSGITLTVAEINVTSGTGNIRCVIDSGTGTPSASGTLTRVSGSGDATISYTSYDSESFNPFWNPNKTGGAGLDFVNYANEYCNGSIDVLISHCGLNDMNRYNPSTMANLFTDYVKPFVRAYHTDFPNGKFVISTLPTPSPTGGMAANYGANATWSYLNIQLCLLAFAKEAWKMAAETEFSGYVVIADDMPVFDAEHSYPSEQAIVNTRSAEREARGTNGAHPLPLGSYQIADAIYARVNGMEW